MSRLFPGFETSDRVFACDGCTTWLYDAMTYDLILWAWVPVWMDCADMINVIVTMTFFYMLVTSYIWFLYYTWLNVTFCYCWSSFALCCLFLHILYYCCPRVVSLSGETPHQRLCRWPPGWDVHCPFAGTGVDGTSQGESGDRTCEARRSPRRHDYTL